MQHRGNPGVPHGGDGPAGDLPGTSGGGHGLRRCPAAVLAEGHHGRSSGRLVATVETLPRRRRRAGMRDPCHHRGGRRVRLAEKFAWRGRAAPLRLPGSLVTQAPGAGRNPGGPAPEAGGGGAGAPGDPKLWPSQEVPGWEAYLTQLEDVILAGALPAPRGVRAVSETAPGSRRDVRRPAPGTHRGHWAAAPARP